MRRAEHPAALALALLALAGCAGPRPAPPAAAAVDPPAAWRTPDAAGGELPATWWRSFDDPALSRLVEAALANNLDVAIAAARIEELAGQARLAQAQRLPNVTAQAVYARERSVNPAFGVPEVQTVGEGLLSASFDVDLFGRLASASDAARATLLSTQAARDDVRLAVAALAAREWFTLRALDLRLATLRETLAARQQTQHLVERRVSVGYSAQLDLAQAEAETRATEQLIPATLLAMQRTEDALSVLLGENPHAIAREDAPATETLPAVPAGLPSALLRRRPDLVEAEERVVAADHALDASRAAFMPDLQLSGSFGQVSSSLIRNDPIDIFSIGGSLLAPLFDAGRLKAQQGSVAARRDEAALAYRKATLKAFAEVEDALAATGRLGEQRSALEAQHAALERSLHIATQRYRAGYAPFLDQLDAQRGLLSVELALAQLRADQANAFVALFQALGGGWERAQVEADPRVAGDAAAIAPR